MKNGHRVTKWPQVGLGKSKDEMLSASLRWSNRIASRVCSGGARINYNQISEDELELLRNYRPELVYGKAVVETPDKFVPATLAFDKKVLRFFGYFKQTVPESPNEYYRVRPIKIFYYLEDDSLEIIEEVQENSGIPQGKLIRRHRFPKNDQGETYNFRDLNLGQNLAIYGKVFRICECDAFTRVSVKDDVGRETFAFDSFRNGWRAKVFMSISRNWSLAILIWPNETKSRNWNRTRRRPISINWNNTWKWIAKCCVSMLSGMIDRRCSVNNGNSSFNTIWWMTRWKCVKCTKPTMVEIHSPCSSLATRFPKIVTTSKVRTSTIGHFSLLEFLLGTFPHVFLELTDTEVGDYFKPSDLMIGKTVNIYGRNFLLYDCDMFTKTFYTKNFGVNNFEPINTQATRQEFSKMVKRERTLFFVQCSEYSCRKFHLTMDSEH